MKTPLYRQAIAHGWRTAWNNKFLWIFGLFAAFLGQMGMMEFLSKAGLVIGDVSDYISSFSAFHSQIVSGGAFAGLSLDNKILVFFLLFLLFALAAALIFVSVTSQGAIIHAAAKTVKNKFALDIAKSWHASVGHFWKLLVLNAVKKGVIMLLAVIVGASAFSAVAGPTFGNSLLFLAIFLLAGAVGLVLSFLVVYAAGYVIVEEYSFGSAVRSAWNMFLDHWLVSFEVGFLVLLFNVVVFLLSLLGFLIFFFPAMLVWFAAIVVGSKFLLASGFVIAIILFTGYMMLLGSVFTVFTVSVWTYLFMKMHKSGIKSRVLHLVSYRKA